MASQGNQDWQSTKNTVLERNSHMFNNPFMSDIEFTCGESKRKRFYAHKYVLATSSAVFYAMLYGDLAEKGPVVHLSDTDDESLEEFLRFLYTDQCTLTPEIAMKVMYLAKKYIIPLLTAKCVEAIQSYLKPENVAIVLEQAIQFDEKELEKKCWEMVDERTSSVVASDAFVNINKKTLINLLKRDTLRVNEVELFQAVSKWAEVECSRDGLDPTGKNKRAVLGDAIYEMRFLSMSEKEFVEHVSFTEVLLDEEIVPIFKKFNGFDVPNVKWKHSQRQKTRVVRCIRFSNVTTGWCYGSGGTDSLSFKVNKSATLHGVRLFGDENCSSYKVSLEVNGATVCVGTYRSEPNSAGAYGFDVMLPTPISFERNADITMAATVQGPSSCFGHDGPTSITADGLTVTLSDSKLSSNLTRATRGQFHHIILST